MQRIALVLAVLLVASPAYAQEEPVRTIPFMGPEVFAHVLHSHHIVPIQSIQDAADDPMQSVIIVLGHPGQLAKITNATGGVDRFLTMGGNFFLATGFGVVQPDLPITINASLPISQPAKRAYASKEECPWLRYTDTPSPEFPDAADHPLFGSLNRGIATNCPSLMSIREPQLVQPLLWYSEPHIAGRDRPSIRPLPYMAGSPKATPARGRELYIAGHGMFMNGMLLQRDNDNLDFTKNAVRWLTEGDDGKTRRRVLLIADGQIIPDFDMNLTPPPPIPIPTKQAINRLLRGLEEERAFHRMLESLMGRHAAVVVAVLLGILTLLTLSYGAKKLMDGRHRFETAVPCMVGVPAPTREAMPIEDRQQAILRKGDLGEEARDLVLEWFETELDVTPNRWHTGVQANFQAAGSFLARWRLQHKADFALRVARAPNPLRVSRHQFFMLVESLKELSAALKDGRLALLVEGKNVRQA